MTDRLAELMYANAASMEAIRPPIPNIGKTAPRFGYRSRALTIYDVVSVDETYPGAKADALSARPGYSATMLPGFAQS
ncbi:hypothetical protein [Microbispora sp. NPDC049633]|uniref:hypothetical protein n=1 Tax=Microbispora sp. NPDC049633 TaxID=3154355 RepID=UPI0034444609